MKIIITLRSLSGKLGRLKVIAVKFSIFVFLFGWFVRSLTYYVGPNSLKLVRYRP